MSNLDITEKESATFECEVSKPGLPAVWYQNGSEITSDWDRFTTSVDGSVHRLVISAAQLDDTKKYRCVIAGVKTSAKLTVTGMCVCGLVHTLRDILVALHCEIVASTVFCVASVF